MEILGSNCRRAFSFVSRSEPQQKIKRLLSQATKNWFRVSPVNKSCEVVGKATRADHIPNKILKIIAALMILQQLSIIFNKSIESNEFPTDFKIAGVSCIFKSGEKNDPSYYRPIPFISCVARVFEKLFYEQFYLYLTNKNLLNAIVTFNRDSTPRSH